MWKLIFQEDFILKWQHGKLEIQKRDASVSEGRNGGQCFAFGPRNVDV